MNVLRKLKKVNISSGQSLVELAIIFPLLLIMLAGMVEVAFGIFAYLTALDLTREAARFASIRDYNVQELDNPSDPTTACTDNVLHFYYDTACFFTDDNLNPFLDFRADKFDDVVITVLTVANNNISDHHPDADGWSLNSDNWKKDCQGNVVRNTPFFSNSYIEDHFVQNAPADRRDRACGNLGVLRYGDELALYFRFHPLAVPHPYLYHHASSGSYPYADANSIRIL